LTSFARENRSRRNLHGNEEKGKKEETLTVCETILRTGQDLTSLSGEAPLERRFLLTAPIRAPKFSIYRFLLVCHNWEPQASTVGWGVGAKR
jgi:hypothetical protein